MDHRRGGAGAGAGGGMFDTSAAGGAKKQSLISFDELNRIRLLNADDFKKTQSLSEECDQFVSKVKTFLHAVSALQAVMSAEADKIERAKLLAIGNKCRIESEGENRRRMELELRMAIKQKQTELHRLNDQYLSLAKVEAEQKQLIDKLSRH